jgi:uncharacterized protein involved in type VI secretion and phage assembly
MPLAPEWRFYIADREVYPIRSLTTQYQESNLSFLERLMDEEGLLYYFEHQGDTDSPSLGSHTMVIADHNGSFKPNKQAQIRFTQSGAVMKEDGIDRWRTEVRQQTNALELWSWDYRSISQRPVSSVSSDDGDGSSCAAIRCEEAGASLHAVGDAMSERPLYRNRIDAITSSTPYRSCPFDEAGQIRHQRPTIRRQQSAMVIGAGGQRDTYGPRSSREGLVPLAARRAKP